MMRLRLQYHLIHSLEWSRGRFGGGGLSSGPVLRAPGISSVGKGDAPEPFRYGNRRGGQCGEGQPTIRKSKKEATRKCEVFIFLYKGGDEFIVA